MDNELSAILVAQVQALLALFLTGVAGLGLLVIVMRLTKRLMVKPTPPKPEYGPEGWLWHPPK